MKHNKQSQAFLILANKPSVKDFYEAISVAAKGIGDVHVLYHQNQNTVPSEIDDTNNFVFSDSILTRQNYIPIGFDLIPGNNHFPLLKFYLSNPVYDYYWCVEEDVRFTGNWSIFFSFFSKLKYDFITSHIRTSSEEPRWYWWHTLAHPYTVIPFERRIRSFNPIYRISRDALHFIHNSLCNHWCGHHEVLLATLLHEDNFSIIDFGGNGRFVLPGLENAYYIDGTPNEHGLLDTGTMRWRPTFKSVGEMKDKLYHPVKSC